MVRTKGVLRIAIEDFLETFDLGAIWFRWYTTLLEKFESEALDTYKEIADKLNITQFLPDILSPDGMRNRMTKRPVQIIPIIIAVGMMVIGILIGTLQPLQRKGSYAVDRKVLSGRPSPLELFSMHYRTGATIGNPYDAMSDLGFDDNFTRGYQALAEQLLSPIDYISAWRRGLYTDTELAIRLKTMGMSENTVNDIKNVTSIIPGVQDMIHFAVREAFSDEVIKRFQYDEAFPEDILQHTAKIGLSDDWVKRYWYAHWQLPSPNQAFEMVHRLRAGRADKTFTAEDLDILLRTADYPVYFRERLAAISYNPITRVDIRRLYKLGIFSSDEVKQRYMDIGYTEADAEQLTQFTVKYETSSGEDKDDEIKRLTENVSKRMYMKGIITRAEYSKQLSELKYTNDVIALLLKLVDSEMTEDMTPDYRKQYISDMTNDIRKAYASKLISETNAKTLLEGLGLVPTHVEFMLKNETYQSDLNTLNNTLKLITDAYVNGTLSRDDFIAALAKQNISGTHQYKIITEVENILQYRNRRLTESQYRTATLRGIITVGDYKLACVGLGYPDKDIDILVKLYLTESE